MSPAPGRSRRVRRRAFVLIAVLVVVTSALLVATGMLFLVQAELATSTGAHDQVQSRLLAWSGVLAVTEQLQQQRDRILEGEAATLDHEYILYEADGREGVVRLLPVTPGGATVSPESARLDLNAATAEMLAATGLVDATLAGAIVAHRDGALDGSFQSIAELLGVPGVDVELVYGPLEDMRLHDDALGAADDLGERMSARLGDDAPRGLADVVTVYAFEPALQRNGRLRINLNVPWSDELGERVDERFGPGASQGLKDLFDAGTTFESEADIYKVLNRLDLAPAEWPDIIDALTADAGDYHYGRLDINTASEEALTALEGIDDQEAAQIVRARGALSADLLATVAWPVTESIVDAAAYETLGGRLTTRSWTYRMRLAAGERVADATGDDAALDNPVIYELVVDLSDPRPRIAYLRDVTLLDTAALVALHADVDPDVDAEADDRLAADEPGPSAPGPPADGPNDDPADEIGDGSDEPAASGADDRMNGAAPPDDGSSGAGEEDDDPRAAATSTPTDRARRTNSASEPAALPDDKRVGRWRRGR